ncbi:AraC family transcriptional regulator [Jiangella sp. DSM 45060]|uniref:AraC family transcriptional regulator n=1 Tax=Jiangella sp. DSM 45060 TaxID=1798224 RepID=UPI00087C39CF|nr:AraC family transcriptional regulator [Jiangella sp. DSM 45060]SDT12171.1 AraC-type DNA-binding protein [Jiangella sp. DSM 45060]
MNPRHERPGIPYGTTFSTFVLHEESFDFSWHYHQAYELALITQGRGTRYVGTTVEPLRMGDLLVLGPDLPHTFTSAQDPDHPAEAACAQFPADFLGADFFALPQFDQIAALLDASVHGIVFSPAPPPVRDILTTLMDQPAALQTARLLEALHLLAVAPGGVPITGPGYISAPDPAVRERVDKVCRHLEQVHTRHVELTEVAGLVHMAPTSFSRFFRRAMGRTLTEYLNQLRVETACRLLTNTNAPIIEIAASSGYVNLSNFNRRFRELKGMSPRDYRQAQLRP